MRTIINISVPEEVALEVKREVRASGFASTSEFFRDAFKAWKRQRFIIETEKSKREIDAGRSRILRSLKDLR